MDGTQGFTNSLFDFYVDSSGNIVGENRIVTTLPATSASSSLRNNYSMVISPTVVQKVRTDTCAVETPTPFHITPTLVYR
jgi:hypothetical protein